MHLKPIAVERYSKAGVKSVLYDGETQFTKNKAYKWRSLLCFGSFKDFFRQVFLPQGYPESVSVDYMEYQIWDTFQALASSVSSALAHQAVLKGFGVGDKSATLLGATITWMMKSGAGMIGRILFAWSKGTFLDCDCKRWRLLADILNDVSMCVDLIAPNFPLLFTPLVCIAGVGFSIVGVAGGATRAALTMHQARRNNLADVSAKDGSQETMSQFLGLLFNFGFMYMVTGNQRMIWFSFFILVLLHIYCNYRAVSAVCMETFNQTRLHYVLSRWIGDGTIASVAQTNSREPLLFPMQKAHTDVLLGCSLEEVLDCTKHIINELLMVYDKEKYILYFDRKGLLKDKKGFIHIVLHEESTDADQLKALLHAELIEFLAAANTSALLGEEMATLSKMFESAESDDDFLVRSLAVVNYLYPLFCSDVTRAGWKLAPVLFGSDEWRCEWTGN